MKPKVTDKAEQRARTIQKLFELSEEIAHRLRDESFVRSRKSGMRVSEKAIVEEALKKYLGISQCVTKTIAKNKKSDGQVAGIL